ncbi:MAG: hypothetical protein P8106_00230 [Gammaproteobacteria bacterium]
MSPRRRAALALGLAGALGAVTFGVARLWPELFPDTQRLEPDAGCDLRQGPCTRTLPGGGLMSFSIRPTWLPLMDPLTLEVALTGASVDGVQVDIVGRNMDMGINRTRLEPAGEGRWTGSTVLPVCSRQRMDWEAAVWLERGDDILAVPHRFETRR